MTIYEQVLGLVKAKFLTDGAFTNTFAVGRQEFLDLLDELFSRQIPFTIEEFSARLALGTDGQAAKFDPYGYPIYVFSTETAGLREL